MRIFVTGGAGFIGRHLVDSFLKERHSVTIYDNFSNSSEDKISILVKNGIKVIRGDIIDYKLLLSSLEGFDTVIHLAAKISVPESVTYPEKTHETNVTGSLNLLRACVKKNVKNIIHASSAAVYGDPKVLPISEDSTTYPTSPYGSSKLSAEHYLQAFANSFNLNCINLRFFNVYGTEQSPEYAGVITKFLEAISAKKPLVIFGDGLSTRDFVDVEDVVRSIHNAISKIDGKRGNCYNIASGMFISINDLAQLMISISDKDLEIVHGKEREGEIKHSHANIDLAKKELLYFPKVGLKEGLKRIIKS